VELNLRSDSNTSESAARHALAPVIEFLLRHAPFDRMGATHLEFLAKHLKLGFYAKGEVITEPMSGAARHFYIIKQGRVRGESANGPDLVSGRVREAGRDTGSARGRADVQDAQMPRRPGMAGSGLGPIGEAAAPADSSTRGTRISYPSEDGAWELVAGECFPIGALLARRPVHTVHRAVEDTFCFELDREYFDNLLTQSPVFHDFCSRRLANLLDQTLQSVQASLATEVLSGEASLSAPLSSLVRREPVTCRPDTPIRQALVAMNEAQVGSIIVTDAERRPLGVFTLHDLLARVATSSISLEEPMEQVMTHHPLSLPPQAPAHEAAMLMAHKGLGHVCVVEDGRLVGVVSERDLFSLQRIGIVQLSRSITGAPDMATLAQLGRDVHRLIDQMLVQGASVAQLMQIATLINDHITRRVIALCVAEQGTPSMSFAWLAFGSEGRQEQTLKTDQDNGILFAVPSGKTAESVRAELLPLATRINQALAECGYPLCRGNIMAGNPECCLSLDEWKDRFRHWIEHGAPEHLLNASIFFDFRVIEGDSAPVEDLQEWVAEHVAANPTFLRQMAENALRNSPPLGLVRNFVVSSSGAHPHTIDLKLNGATPFVDGARLLALAHCITETGTLARLRAAAKAGVVRTSEAEAWCDAYAFIQLLRMRAHQTQERQGLPLENHIDPDRLNELDRRILKEAFRQARKLQARIALDYRI
jgi:CBS domain-containing protein